MSSLTNGIRRQLGASSLFGAHGRTLGLEFSLIMQEMFVIAHPPLILAIRSCIGI
jgi:hypothetical protein